MSTQITFLGHATVQVKTETSSLLTDPVLSDRVLWLRRRRPFPLMRAGPQPTGTTSFPGPQSSSQNAEKCQTKNLQPTELAEPSVLLISHAHYDHLDIPSFKYFSQKIPVVLPKGLGRFLTRFVRNPLIELSHGASHEIRPGLRVTAFPVAHPGFRLSGLTYRASNGYLIEVEGTKIFFAGDTAYRSDFKIFKGVPVALLPVGPCQPEWFMRRRHLNPEDALRVLEELEAKVMIPIHWGTFRLGLEPIDEPIEGLRSLVQGKGLTSVAFLNTGEKLTLT